MRMSIRWTADVGSAANGLRATVAGPVRLVKALLASRFRKLVMYTGT